MRSFKTEQAMQFWTSRGVSARAAEVLVEVGASSLESLSEFGELDLLRQKNFGRKALRAVKGLLAENNLALSFPGKGLDRVAPAPSQQLSVAAKLAAMSDSEFLEELRGRKSSPIAREAAKRFAALLEAVKA